MNDQIIKKIEEVQNILKNEDVNEYFSDILNLCGDINRLGFHFQLDDWIMKIIESNINTDPKAVLNILKIENRKKETIKTEWSIYSSFCDYEGKLQKDIEKCSLLDKLAEKRLGGTQYFDIYNTDQEEVLWIEAEWDPGYGNSYEEKCEFAIKKEDLEDLKNSTINNYLNLVHLDNDWLRN